MSNVQLIIFQIYLGINFIQGLLQKIQSSNIFKHNIVNLEINKA